MILKRASRSISKPTFTIVDDKFIILNEIQDNRAKRQLVDKSLISGIDFSRTYQVSYDLFPWRMIDGLSSRSGRSPFSQKH